MNIDEFIRNPDLIGDGSLSPAQNMVVKSVYGNPLTGEELGIFKQTTGLREYPEGKEWEEVVLILARRAGKGDKLASNIALFEACAREHHLSRGEVGVVMLVSTEVKRQSRILYNYILHKLEASPVLSRLIKNVTAEEISLSNGVVIQVYPCHQARIRGASLICFIGDEVAHWKVEGRNVDTDVLDSARPGLSFPHSKMVKISTPYMMKGEIYNDFKRYYGKPNDDVLVHRGSTELFNPAYPKRKLERMKKRNPVTYITEYEAASFRTDLSVMYDPEVIDKAVNHDRPLELPPKEDVNYRAFVDVAGGSGRSSYAIAIGHVAEERIVIDVVRSRAPKFNPEEVTAQYCELLKQYRTYAVSGDKFSGDWASNSHASRGIFYEPSPKSKSELYLESESLFNTGRVEIPDRETLVTQLKYLVRKVRPGGKDSVDADMPEDEANVVAGVCWQLFSLEYEKPLLPPSLGLLEDDEDTSEDRLARESEAWLRSERPQPKAEEDDFNESEWDLTQWSAIDIMRELEKEKSKSTLAEISDGWEEV